MPIGDWIREATERRRARWIEQGRKEGYQEGYEEGYQLGYKEAQEGLTSQLSEANVSNGAGGGDGVSEGKEFD